MKIIDLLVKISKGEEVPKKIRYKGKEYTLIRKQGEILYQYEDYHAVLTLQDFNKLNDEIEIIEEKEIDKWGKGALEEIKTTERSLRDLQKYIEIIMETQNDIIDVINEMRDKE